MTHIIFAHPYYDPAIGAFRTAVINFCGAADSINRVDENVIAPKGSPDAVYLGKFFSFDQAAFVNLVQSIPWQFPSGIQAFVRHSNQLRFAPLNLEVEYDLGRNAKLIAPFGWGFDVPTQQMEFLTVTYVQLLERRRELIRDSIRNPNRFLHRLELLTSVSTSTPWLFDCVEIFPERRVTSSSRHQYGPGKDDGKMITTEHRMIDGKLAVRGIHIKFMCDIVEVGREIFTHVQDIAASLCSGDRVWIGGILDIQNDGTCLFKKVHNFAKASAAASPGEP